MIYAANFKTNHTRKSTQNYIKELQEKLQDKKSEDSDFIFPPFKGRKLKKVSSDLLSCNFSWCSIM
jgi:triosephosphate isomerase